MTWFLDFVGAGSTPGETAADWDGLDFALTGNPSQNAGGLTFTLNPDGTWNCPVPRSFGTESGNWFTPTTEGVGNDYEARFTPTGFTGYPESVTSNDAASWESLASGLSFVFGLSGSFVSDAGTVLVEVRDTATSTVVASGTFTMSIDLT